MIVFRLTMHLKRISLLSGKAGIIEEAECTHPYMSILKSCPTPHESKLNFSVNLPTGLRGDSTALSKG